MTGPLPDSASTPRPGLELADIVRACGPALLQGHGDSLTAVQRRALRDVAACRTAALGGHVERCTGCGHERICYNSCRNRHCPRCQAAVRAQWLERERSWLLPVEYHHVVFTLPAEVAVLALAHPALVYGLLFEAASATLREVAANPRYLGAQVGVVAVLHTWGQNLHHHPHLHCLVSGGGLSCDGQGRVQTRPRWRFSRQGFLLPVRVLSRVFRGKFLALLAAAQARGRLSLGGSLAELASPPGWAAWLRPRYAQEWVVYSQPPCAGPEVVLKYLARYVHRVAISNSRLVSLCDGQVTFRYKDYAQQGKQRLLTLSGVEFLRRWLQHVLPKGFVKVRHYGLLASRAREEKLACCRWQLLLAGLRAVPLPSPAEAKEAPSCPVCGGGLWACVGELAKRRCGRSGSVAWPDSS